MTKERELRAKSGWPMLIAMILGLVVIIALFVLSIVQMASYDDAGLAIPAVWIALLVVSIVLFCLWFIPLSGFFTLQPGQARVCILFGEYKGTVRDEASSGQIPFIAITWDQITPMQTLLQKIWRGQWRPPLLAKCSK